MSPPIAAHTQRITIDDNMPPRCIEHVRLLDSFDARLTNLEKVCEDLKDLPAKVSSIANTLKIQTLMMGGLLAAMLPKIIDRMFP
jgi:hypothetical protein